LKGQDEGRDVVLGKDEAFHPRERNEMLQDLTEGVMGNPLFGFLPEVEGLYKITGVGVSVGDDLLPSSEEIHGGELNLVKEVLSCSR